MQGPSSSLGSVCTGVQCLCSRALLELITTWAHRCGRTLDAVSAERLAMLARDAQLVRLYALGWCFHWWAPMPMAKLTAGTWRLVPPPGLPLQHGRNASGPHWVMTWTAAAAAGSGAQDQSCCSKQVLIEALLQRQTLRVRNRQLPPRLQHDECSWTRLEEPQGSHQIEVSSSDCTCSMQRAGVAVHNDSQALVQI